MIKTYKFILLDILFGCIVISGFLFSCKNISVKKVNSVEPIDIKTNIKVPVAIIDTEDPKKDTTNIVIGNPNNTQDGFVDIKNSNIKGLITNKSNVKNSANIAIGTGAKANMGSVIINKSGNIVIGNGAKANMGSVSTSQNETSINIDVKPDKTANTPTGTDVSYPENTTTEAVKTKSYKEYKVELGADKKITMPGIPGQLRVWIGIPEYKPKFSPEMIHATGTLPAVGTTAKVIPVAPAFKVEPKESDCLKIHPTGSETGFKLIPIEEGTFEVGADVKLYDSVDCSGTPIPKATTYLKVQVVVDHAKEMKKHTKKFKEVFWEKLLEFWGGILAVFFALLLFLLRRHLKKWFGFADKN